MKPCDAFLFIYFSFCTENKTNQKMAVEPRRQIPTVTSSGQLQLEPSWTCKFLTSCWLIPVPTQKAIKSDLSGSIFHLIVAVVDDGGHSSYGAVSQHILQLTGLGKYGCTKIKVHQGHCLQFKSSLKFSCILAKMLDVCLFAKTNVLHSTSLHNIQSRCLLWSQRLESVFFFPCCCIEPYKVSNIIWS